MRDATLEGKIENLYESACEKAGVDSYYLDEYIMAAAVKASVLFQVIGYEYGDRTPSVYKLKDTIRELFASLLDSDSGWNSTGMFKVSRIKYDDEAQPDYEKFLELSEFGHHRIESDK